MLTCSGGFSSNVLRRGEGVVGRGERGDSVGGGEEVVGRGESVGGRSGEKVESVAVEESVEEEKFQEGVEEVEE